MKSNGAGGEGALGKWKTGERKLKKGMCVSAELLMPIQALSWAKGQHVAYPCLCVGIFAVKRPHCLVKLLVVGDKSYGDARDLC